MTDAGAVTSIVQASLQNRPHQQAIAPFSGPGYSTLEKEIAAYVGDLVDESARIARRSRADDVSSSHVQQAAQNLTTRARKRLYGHIGTLGGIVLGAGLSSVLTILVSPPPISTVGFLVSVAFTALGAFVVAISIART